MKRIIVGMLAMLMSCSFAVAKGPRKERPEPPKRERIERAEREGHQVPPTAVVEEMKKRVAMMFKMADKDKDGQLSKEEFTGLMLRLRARMHGPRIEGRPEGAEEPPKGPRDRKDPRVPFKGPRGPHKSVK